MALARVVGLTTVPYIRRSSEPIRSLSLPPALPKQHRVPAATHGGGMDAGGVPGFARSRTQPDSHYDFIARDADGFLVGRIRRENGSRQQDFGRSSRTGSKPQPARSAVQ